MIVGGPDDRTLAQEIAVPPVPNAVDATGTLSLLASAELIGRCAVLVTNDSAPLHLASAMGTPTVAIFGPTVPEFGFGPLAPSCSRRWARRACRAGRAIATGRNAARSDIGAACASSRSERGRARGATRVLSPADLVTHARMTTASAQQYIIGVDLGGTNIVAGAMTADGSRASRDALASRPTRRSGDEGGRGSHRRRWSKA